MDMNAREAMHVIELRTSPQGHPAYRRICQEMLRLIDQQAGHHSIAAAMSHADFSGAAAGRLDAERRTAERRRARPATVDAVIFDMDGVLVDSEPLALEAMREVMARQGVTYTEADNDEFLGRTTIETCRALRARHALEPGEAELARQYLDAMLALIRERPRPQPGVPEVLRAVRADGHRLALASSAEPELIRAHTEALGIGDLFEVAVSAVEMSRGKPAPDVFLETARRLGVPPARCLVVEDSRNGLLAAKAAGMTCAVVPCTTTRHQDFREADHRLDALSGLIDVLKR
jgi:HAD superfamily hydrolase (TIGR01509 family)